MRCEKKIYTSKEYSQAQNKDKLHQEIGLKHVCLKLNFELSIADIYGNYIPQWVSLFPS